jgi:hypothetical protein
MPIAMRAGGARGTRRFCASEERNSADDRSPSVSELRAPCPRQRDHVPVLRHAVREGLPHLHFAADACGAALTRSPLRGGRWRNRRGLRGERSARVRGRAARVGRLRRRTRGLRAHGQRLGRRPRCRDDAPARGEQLRDTGGRSLRRRRRWRDDGRGGGTVCGDVLPALRARSSTLRLLTGRSVSCRAAPTARGE